MTAITSLTLCQADYTNPQHMQALLDLLDGYARDPMGGAEPLSDFAKTNLPQALAARAYMFSVLAFDATVAGLPVGLVNCVEGFSTFACKPLVNVHDVVVASSHRGRGIAARLFAEVSDARALIRAKELYELFEEAVDRCEDAADVLHGVVLERI